MEFKPFENTEEVEKLRNMRDELIDSLSGFDIGEDEKKFIIRKLQHITEKLVEKQRYTKDINVKCPK